MSVICIRLVAVHAECPLGMSGINAKDGQPERFQGMPQPGRERSALKADEASRRGFGANGLGDVLWLGRALSLSDLLAFAINGA